MTKNQIQFLGSYKAQYEALKARYQAIERSNLPNKDALLKQINEQSRKLAEQMQAEAEGLR